MSADDPKPVEKPIENSIRIAFSDLPPAVCAALLSASRGQTAPADSAQAPDIVISGRPAGVRAVPVLTLARGQPQRLRDCLRLALRMAAAPALYLDLIDIGAHRLDCRARRFDKPHASIDLTDRETDILIFLARAGAAGMTRKDLLTRVWRYAPDADTHTLETHIYRLRQKIENDPATPSLLLTTDAGYALAG